MRKTAAIICMTLVFMLLPAIIYAEEYAVVNDELTISFDDPEWIVFTRDNIKNNRQLKKLDTDYKTMKATMDETEAYIVAVKGGSRNRMEMLVRVRDNAYINNMNTLRAEDMKALRKGIDDTYSDSLENYSSTVCTVGDNRYIRMTGEYEKDHYDVVQYATFINGKNYLISVQKVINYTKEDIKEIEGIVASADFRIDPDKSENHVDAYVEAESEKMNNSRVSAPVKAVATAAVVGAVLLLLRFKNRRHSR